MIFLEGVDGSGKTTLGHILSSTLGLKFLTGRLRPTGIEILDQQVKACSGILNDLSRCHIYDRHPILSELIYGKVIRKEYLGSQEEMRRYFMQLLSSGDFFVYCRPPLTAIHSNILNSEQMSGVREYAFDLIGEYDFFFKKARLSHFFQYDYTQPTQIEVLIEEIGLYTKLKSTHQFMWNQFNEYPRRTKT